MYSLYLKYKNNMVDGLSHLEVNRARSEFIFCSLRAIIKHKLILIKVGLIFVFLQEAYYCNY